MKVPKMEGKKEVHFGCLAKNKTVLIIAHRMRTVANADKIVVLANGYVSRMGNHKKLIKKNGLYKHMADIQTESSDWSLK